jgi:hypothetical protein
MSALLISLLFGPFRLLFSPLVTVLPVGPLLLTLHGSASSTEAPDDIVVRVAGHADDSVPCQTAALTD